jgi:hypothetical protein
MGKHLHVSHADVYGSFFLSFSSVSHFCAMRIVLLHLGIYVCTFSFLALAGERGSNDISALLRLLLLLLLFPRRFLVG